MSRRNDRGTSRSINYSASPLLASKTPMWRSKFIVASLAIAFAGVGAGAVYVHTLQPNQHLDGSKPLTLAEEDLMLAAPEGLRREVQRGYPLLQQAGSILQAGGEHFFDLTGMFAEWRETLYEDSCCHLNRLGRLLLAEALAGALLASLPDPAQRPDQGAASQGTAR